ncbi:MAG: hypothetical protein JO301_07900 [Chitinophagaceae bacterium]|nr:hypothetical protein [Chitinophagaceae bacterium]
MKKILSVCSILLLSATWLSASAAGGLDAEKSKSYSKSYPLSSGDRITLNNSFGEMKISTWSKNEIKVDVSMTVKAGTDQRAQEILDNIRIEDKKSGSEVSFKTELNNDKDDRRENRHRDRDDETSFKINYTVYLPDNMALEAINNFGPLSIGDYNGNIVLDSRFGSLNAGKLNQPKKVTVQFGKATIESINNGKLSVQFSKAQVNRMMGDITVELNQAHGVKFNLTNDLKKLDVHNNFSELYLDADKNLSANFNVRTSFGGFSNKTDFPVTQERDNEHRYFNSNSSYSGKSGSGNIPVTIKSSFGHVTLGHDISFDVNEKNEHKKARA